MKPEPLAAVLADAPHPMAIRHWSLTECLTYLDRLTRASTAGATVEQLQSATITAKQLRTQADRLAKGRR